MDKPPCRAGSAACQGGALQAATPLPVKPQPQPQPQPFPKIADLGIVLVPITAGSYFQGSPDSEPGRVPIEQRCKVTLTRGFWILAHEVTQEQFEKVTGYNPS